MSDFEILGDGHWSPGTGTASPSPLGGNSQAAGRRRSSDFEIGTETPTAAQGGSLSTATTSVSWAENPATTSFSHSFVQKRTFPVTVALIGTGDRFEQTLRVR
jgi:hypothetical protein